MNTLGHYRIVREIARSNDIVYEAVDPVMNRRIAIKELLLPPNLSGQARRERIERFYREARAAGAMNHPNIVTIYEVGEDQGRYFISMEFLEGQTLRQRLTVAGTLASHEAVAIIAALCDALEYAHRRGVVHRDIKPDNVHLLPGGGVKLTDFGIARILHEDQLTVAGQVFGTPSYMSPEQIKGGTVDARSDIFSLGILFYEMLAGRKPFTGDSVVTITYRILNEAMPALPGATPALETVIQRATSKDPANRFPSAGAFRDAILAAAAGRSPLGLPSEPSFATRPASSAPPTVGYPISALPTASSATLAGARPPAAAGRDDALSEPSYTDLAAARRRRSTRVFVGAVAALGVTTIGVGWALSRAFQGFQGQSVLQEADRAYNKAAQMYRSEKYEPAAEAFRQIRLSGKASGAILQKASEGELFCYRWLGQQAQSKGDFAAAVRWFEKAVALAPNDEKAKTELAAARQAQGARAPASPSDDGPAPERTAALPRSAAPNPPGATTEEFVAANDSAAQEAQEYYDRGETAWKQGNWTSALRNWTAALSAGPGSPAAQQAQQRIQRFNRENNPLGAGG